MRYIHITDASKVVMIREPTPQDYKYFNSLQDDLDHDDDVDDHVHTVDDVCRHGHRVVAPPLPSCNEPLRRSIDDHNDIDMMNAVTINNNLHPNQLFNQPLYTAVPSINGTPASSAVVGTHTITTSAAAAAVHSTNSSVDHHHHSSSSGSSSSSSSSSSSNSSSSRRQEVIAPSSMAPPPIIVMSQHKVDVPVSTAFTVGLIDEGKVVKPMPIALRRKMIADQQHQQQLGEVLMMLMILMMMIMMMIMPIFIICGSY